MTKSKTQLESPEEFNLLKQYLWGYFELHANQRISLFKFYLTITSLFYTGMGLLIWHLKKDGDLPVKVGVILCILFFISTIIFWLIDNRIRNLINYSEAALRKMEEDYILSSQFQIFREEEKKSPCVFFRHSGLFRTFFLINILVALSIIRFLSCSW